MHDKILSKRKELIADLQNACDALVSIMESDINIFNNHSTIITDERERIFYACENICKFNEFVGEFFEESNQ